MTIGFRFIKLLCLNAFVRVFVSGERLRKKEVAPKDSEQVTPVTAL